MKSTCNRKNRENTLKKNRYFEFIRILNFDLKTIFIRRMNILKLLGFISYIKSKFKGKRRKRIAVKGIRGILEKNLRR